MRGPSWQTFRTPYELRDEKTRLDIRRGLAGVGPIEPSTAYDLKPGEPLLRAIREARLITQDISLCKERCIAQTGFSNLLQ
jgi:hypothetical protein